MDAEARIEALDTEEKKFAELPNPSPPSPKYPGSGTSDCPYVVDWDVGDPGNPYNWSHNRKWLTTLQVCASCLIY